MYPWVRILRVEFADCPDCEHLRIVTKDELSSRFYETSSSWGDHQNTPCYDFAKGPRFLNMVMTFVLHPLSHYKSITEPRARFSLSLLEDISIDFFSHFILSLINVYKDTVTSDKFIFPSAITQFLCHFSVSLLESPYFTVMCAIYATTVRQSNTQLRSWHLLLQRHLRTRTMTMTLTTMMMMRRMLAHPVMMRCPLDILPFITCDKKRE